MRVERRKEKIKEKVVLPDNLKEFLCDVYQLIQDRDEAAFTESDDLIQCEFAYGGLSEKQGRIKFYEFTYFPGKGVEHKWYLRLNEFQIQDIASSQLESLTMWACASNNCKSKFYSPDESCFYCDYVEE